MYDDDDDLPPRTPSAERDERRGAFDDDDARDADLDERGDVDERDDDERDDDGRDDDERDDDGRDDDRRDDDERDDDERDDDERDDDERDPPRALDLTDEDDRDDSSEDSSDEDSSEEERRDDDREERAAGGPPERPAAGAPEIPLERIDTDALWVVRRLRAKGHEAYLTGGCVRDLLLGRRPKDFDVATAAHPDEVKRVFRNCRLIGRRFRLAHVTFPGGKVIETATFRANPLDLEEDLPEDLLVERDNVFGNVEQDARRRDLTINGLFYDPIEGKVLDFVDGRTDLEKRLVRTIGDPDIRFQEDPVRIIRAIKFATRLEFGIEEATWAAMKRHTGGLVRCAPARLQEELQRLLLSGHAERALALCEEVGVLQALMPELLEGLADLSLVSPKPDAEAEPDAGDPEGRGERVAPANGVHPEAAPPPDDEDPEADPASGAMLDELTAPDRLFASPKKRAGRPIPGPAERRERLTKVLTVLDEVRGRGIEVSSAVAYGALLLPVWEAVRASTRDENAWLERLGATWTERLRMTRHDRETVHRLLHALDDLEHRRYGGIARSLVSRPWFREALLVFTIARHAAGKPLDEVGAWKAIALHYDRPYRQPTKGERAPRPKRARRRQQDRRPRGRRRR